MRTISQEDAERLMLDLPTTENLRQCSQLYSAQPHLAGDRAHAERIASLWRSYLGDDFVKLVQYDVLQNFPEDASLKLHGEDTGVAVFQASLREDSVPGDKTSSPDNGLPSFHGFGANGDLCAELVYANFGTLADFQQLEKKGVDVQGRIVICKYGKVFRGLKVRAAEKFGAVGVIIYSDPQEDGDITVQNGHKPYPEGPARHPSCVQRGSVDFFSVAVGDPTTPGYPSLPGEETQRRDPWMEGAIPIIPSLPISYADALPFLRALDGCGLSPDEVQGGEVGDWRGALEGATYHTGPSRAKVSLYCKSEYRYSPIYNVIATVEGRTDEIVLLGSHHDSWSCGAVDPVSGSAALNEVVRGLGELRKRGWQPYRKLIMASWDNEEYGLVGSTEFGEEHAKELTEKCVAYINVDESTNGGTILGAVGSPLLADPLLRVMTMVPSPLHDSQTVYQDWLHLSTTPQSPMGVMGTGSDYTVFFHHLGIPSLDMVFNQRSTVVYPYHSNYDSYFWMQKFGDPGFRKHLAMARLWGVLAVRLAGVPVLGFKGRDYAMALRRHVRKLGDERVEGLDLKPLEEKLTGFAEAMQALDQLAGGGRVFGPDMSQPLDVNDRGREVAEINRRYKKVEQSFLLDLGKGLPGRSWFRHMVFAPGLWAGYDGVAFPGIVESIESGDIPAANEWVRRIAQAVGQATMVALGRD